MKELLFVPVLIALAGSTAMAKDTYPPLDVLLSMSESVLGQPLAYPDGQPQVTAAIVTMVTGQETGWHHHDVPLFAYILDGEMTVDYGPEGTKTYVAGDSFIEAFRTGHNGINTGSEPLRILAVFMGSDRATNTVIDPQD